MIIASTICGGLVVFLWGLLGFPKKLGSPKIFKDQTCTGDASACSQGWNRINRNCFFQSERETTWIDGQANCMTYNGSLAMLSSKNEMDSLMHSLGPSSYWFGLSKQNGSTLWMWANGAAFDNWFNIEEGGNCAFMFKEGISSASCDDARKYICSRKSLCP
ncbi:early activation antigen CD69-like [Loxodonta africana]|uniref:early activation antigen CD69-like n=1 Tax=Loxodonta africana TaxID=9785 RepID=UPI0030CA75FD